MVASFMFLNSHPEGRSCVSGFWGTHCIKHQQVYAQKNGSKNNYKYAKIEHSKATILHQQLAEMVAASKLPAYRPAGTPSGLRRPGEHFHEQIQQIAKARLAVPGGQINTAKGSTVPKAPAKAIEGRLRNLAGTKS